MRKDLRRSEESSKAYATVATQSRLRVKRMTKTLDIAMKYITENATQRLDIRGFAF